MKTSNKILLGGLIVLILFVVSVIIFLKVNYSKQLKQTKENTEKHSRDSQNLGSLEGKENLSIQWKQDSDQRVAV